jgi:hypothetical protein
LGYVIECLVEAYVLIGAAGRLTTARPDVDVDHKDFIVDKRGGYRSHYVQVKGSSRLSKSGRFTATVDYIEHRVLSDPRLIYVFCLVDLKAMVISRAWIVPASDFSRMASRTHLSNGHLRLTFEAGRIGKWDRFAVDPRLMGERIIEHIEASNRKRTARTSNSRAAA